MPEDPYSDPVTGVLYNKLGLGTAAGLEAAEREITHAALILLDESPVSPSYDLPHLQEIHKRIFGDIYEWAGQIRTVAIAKGAMFCLPQYIDSSAAVIFGELHDEDCLRGLRRDAFVGRLAHYLGEVNALRPFREGIGHRHPVAQSSRQHHGHGAGALCAHHYDDVLALAHSKEDADTACVILGEDMENEFSTDGRRPRTLQWGQRAVPSASIHRR